ncbi:U7 snRNA-associated Sm-like protein LSm10 [Lepeophtheirus salmonis]|uniref:U7 snRNA-associated Sm-like protein LSm10 n=1 Tax=Lepeophtheirus salmonis TaxID=72036 RepID=UPI001AE8EDFE|nr:uncharacterized protein LOC121114555 [Lepeophtheirus salmonis]
MSSGREAFYFHNTLACILRGCLGSVTTIELRNDSSVKGRIIEVDGFMNTTMAESLFIDASGRHIQFDKFFVPARLIRCFQIPSQINMVETMNEQIFGRGDKSKGRGRREFAVGRGTQKIMDKRSRRRMEDLQNAMKMKEEMSKKKESD